MQKTTNNVQSRNFVIDGAKIYSAMELKGYDTIEKLATALGVHRNTIQPYLSGQRAFPDCLDRMLKLLDLSPGEAIIQNIRSQHQYGLEIATLVASLVQLAPQNAYILFGSRAKGSFRKYSDYDVGVFNSEGLSFFEFSKLIDLAEDWNKDRSYDVNLTNFTLLEGDFIEEIRSHWVFLGGNLASWIKLQEQSGIVLYE